MPAAHRIATGLYPPKSVAGEKPARPFRFDPSRILPTYAGSSPFASHKQNSEIQPLKSVNKLIKSDYAPLCYTRHNQHSILL